MDPDLFENLVFLFVGCGLGYILGRFSKSLKDIKERLDVVDQHVIDHNKGEDGFITWDTIKKLALFLVVLLTAASAFYSQVAVNQAQDLDDRQTATDKALERVTECNKKYLKQSLVVLNDQTNFTQTQVQANVDVQTAQAEFFLGIYEDPANDALELRLFRRYVKDLEAFVEISKQVLDAEPFPTDKELDACLAGEQE